MLKKELVKSEEYVIIAKICDKCGRVAENVYEDMIEWQEFISIYISGGYGSIFGDGSILTCDFCQQCAKELFGGYLHEYGED